MASGKRSGAESSKARAALLDAAERLMCENGYAAVTTRRLAEEASVNAGLIHYYFGTMDDLFIALFRKLADRLFLRQEQIVHSENPLRVLWNISADSSGVMLTNEFMALANHREAVREEIAKFGERWRRNQIQIIAEVMKGRKVTAMSFTLEGVAVFLESIARGIGMEKAMGITSGHDQALGSMMEFIQQLDPPDYEEEHLEL